jgi:2-isopropylmalate synthase
VRELLREVKELESQGYAFEGADGSFELLMRKALEGGARAVLPPDRLPRDRREAAPRRAADRRGDDPARGPRRPRRAHRRAGQRPVHALDQALRKALAQSYPEVEEIQLHDYKVRVLGSAEGDRGARARADRVGRRRAALDDGGVSHDVIEASWRALVDSVDYKLHRARRPGVGRRRTAVAPRG